MNIKTLFALIFSLTLVYSPTGYAERQNPSSQNLISAEEWARPRSAPMFLSLSGVTSAARQFNQKTNSIMKIHYPGGETGSLWASEVRSWFIALGIPSKRIKMQAGGVQDDFIELKISDSNPKTY